MTRVLTITGVAITVVFSLACGGADLGAGGGGAIGGGGNSGNKEACLTWVEHQNSLECMPESAHMKPDQACPDAINMSPLDMSGYYECMVKASKCNGKIPDMSGVADCKMPTM